MSVGPGKIRVFTVVAKNTEKGQPKKARPPVKARPQKAAHKDKRAPSRPSPAPPGARPLSRPIEATRVKLRLQLSEKQRTRLEGLFRAPLALAGLLRAYPQRLVTPTDASVFLLSNRKELDGYINPDARGRVVDLLTELLLQWAGDPPDSIGIDFDDVSLTPDQKVYLPLEGFRGVEVAEPLQLLELRKGRRFSTPFTLFEEDKHFMVALTLEPKVRANQQVQGVKQLGIDNKPKAIQLKPGQPLPYISGMRNQPKEPRQRVLFSKYCGVFSGGLKPMNWDGLSGRGVNGGLPSLGKKSR